MAYAKTLPIPAGTTAADPAEVILALAYGTIREVMIIIPPGHAGLTRLRILYHESAAFPRNPESYYYGDDTVVHFPCNYPIHSAPWELKLQGWAPDATLPHSIQVEVGLIEEAMVGPPPATFVPLPEGV